LGLACFTLGPVSGMVAPGGINIKNPRYTPEYTPKTRRME